MHMCAILLMPCSVAIELLQHFPKLAYLNLCDNKLETVENLESCRELWHLDLCHNKVRIPDCTCMVTRFPSFLVAD